MSRIGKMPIVIPSGVQVKVEGHQVAMKGPKGEESKAFHPDMSIELADGRLLVKRPSDSLRHRALHGLTRALLANMVRGVNEGFKKGLAIEGTGYRAEMQGGTLLLWVGFSHPVRIEPPKGINITVERGAKNLTVEGTDKELVGEVAAKIRAVKEPEPYRGKGIYYAGETIRRKAGKAGRAGIA